MSNRFTQDDDDKLYADRAQRWEKAAAYFGRRGFNLPPYDSDGAVVSLADPSQYLEFRGVTRHALLNFLQVFYVDLKKLGSYDFLRTDRCPCGSGYEFQYCHGLRILSHDKN